MIGMIVFAAFLVWGFYRRKRVFPAAYGIFSVASVAFAWLDVLLTTTVDQAADALAASPVAAVRNLVSALIWIAYMCNWCGIRSSIEGIAVRSARRLPAGLVIAATGKL